MEPFAVTSLARNYARFAMSISKKNLQQVLVFDKNADETISWISEKEAEISTDELGQDLETIQSLLERQQGFQRDLAAIQQQVILIVFVLFLRPREV